MLVLDSLYKLYGDAVALHGVSVSLPTSGYAVIVGQSGSGKTTLLRAVAGHIDISSGTVTLAGENITHLPAHERPVTSVFQQYALFPHLTVAQNIAFGLEQQSMAPERIRARISEMLDLVGLIGLEDRKPGTLSGGQQQRIALARALAPSPSAVMLDEPLGALDPDLRTNMRRELARIQRESGVLFLHVSHDREEAWTLAEHLLILHEGALIGAGELDKLHADPGNDRVARVLGYDNILTHSDQPEQLIAFAPERVEPGRGTWRGRVESQHLIGAVMERVIRLENDELIRQRAVADSDDQVSEIGESIVLHVPVDAIRVVDRL